MWERLPDPDVDSAAPQQSFLIPPLGSHVQAPGFSLRAVEQSSGAPEGG